MIEGNLLGTERNLFMVRSSTATRDVALPARHTFPAMHLSQNAQIILNDLGDLS